jgi:hypothetical protein
MDLEVFDPWKLALERAENFVRTFNVPEGFQYNLAHSYVLHGRLARMEERKAILRQFEKWGFPHDDIDFQWMLENIEKGEHWK